MICRPFGRNSAANLNEQIANALVEDDYYRDVLVLYLNRRL